MKRLIFAVGCLALTSTSFGAVALVQRSTGTYSGTTTCTVTTRAVGSGNYLMFGLAANVTSNPSSVKSTNNTLVLVSSAVVSAVEASYIYGLANSVAGDASFTATIASAFGDCAVFEFSGVATSAATDRMQILNNGASGNPENGATVTPTNSGDMCVACLTAHTSVTSVTSWTGSFPANGNGFAFRAPGSTSALTPSWGGDISGSQYCATTACFLPAAVASTSGFSKSNRLQRYD